MAVDAHAGDIKINGDGTLLKARESIQEVVYVITKNSMSGSESSLDEEGKRQECSAKMARRNRECAAAAAGLGTKAIHFDHSQ